MATNNRITYTLDFKANFKDVQGQLNSLRQSLNSVASAGFGAHIAPNIQKASQAAIALQGHLKKALDPSTGRLDLSRLQTQLSASGQSAKTLGTNLLQGGREGAQAFLQLSNAIVNAQKPMHRFSELSRSLWTTLKNTVKWQISSTALNAVTSALSNSVRFATDLDTSLNKIRIVSGASRQEMEKFAVEANKAAKSLSSSTTAFTDATLIYRQQGDTAAEAQKKAEITIKAANVAGVKAQEMSEYLTGIWNSYQVGTKDLELFIDKLVRVGAVTATSAEELSTSMTKVAATANTVGVSYDQLLSTIATVSSATRTSAETIGTAFKTIYARMGDLELKGSIDEDGVTTTLGTVSSQLKQVGVDVLDANGEIRDMGLVVEDLGNKWQTMSLNQKTAIAEAVAGKRQYTQLFALFDNWSEYTRTLNETATAQGELNKQQSKYEDSVRGAQQRFKAAKEDFLLDAGFGGESIKLFLDGASTIMDALDEITEAAGGIEPILLALGAFMMQKFAPQISQGLVDIGAGIASTFGMGQTSVEKVRSQMQQLFAEARNNKDLQDPVSQASINSMQALLEAQTNLENKSKNLNSQERERLKIVLDIIKAKHQEELATASTNYRNAQDAISTSERYLKSNSPAVGYVTGDVDTKAIIGSANARNLPNVEAMMEAVQQATGKTTISIREFAGVLEQLEITDNDAAMLELSQAMTQQGNSSSKLVSNLRILGDNVLNITNLENDLKESVRQCTSALENEGLIAGDTSDEEADIHAKKEQIKTYDELIQKIKELNNNHAKNPQGKTRTRPKDDYFAAAELLNKENVTTEEIDKNIATLKSHKKDIETNKTDSNLIQAAKDNYNKEQEAVEDLIQALEQLKQKKQEDNNTPPPKSTFKETAENVTKNIGAVAQGMTSLAMAGSSFNSMMEENASGMQRLMSVGMLLNSVMGVASAINKTAIKDYAALAVANIFYRKEIKATGEALKAKAAAEFLSNTASKGVVGATVAATTALVIGLVALYKYNKANSEGAKQAKKFAAAEKEIEKNTEELSDKESKLDTFTSLKEKLEDATTSASKLAEVEKELNKELGINIDLVNGGAEARARANAILNSSINATEDEVEEIKKRNAEERKRAIANLGMESTNDKLSREDSLYVLREFNKKSELYQEKFWSGEYGNEDFETGGSYGLEGFSPNKMKDFIDKNNEYIKNEIQNDILPYYSSSIAGQLQTISTELLESGYDPQSFLDAYRENYNEIETAFTSGDSETLSELLDELYSFDSKESTKKSEQAFKNFKQKILAFEKDTNKEIKNELENSSTVLSNSFTGLRNLADANSNLLDSFAKNKTLDTETISKYVTQIKEDLQLSADEATQIQEALLNADSKEDIGNIIGNVTLNQILKNKTLLDQIGTSEGFNQIVKIFSENNIANAKELATQIQKNVNVAKELNKQFSENSGFVSALKSEPRLMAKEWKERLEQLQNEYGYTEEAAHALLMQETIFNNSSLNVNQRINALQRYIQVMGLADTELGKIVNSSIIDPENFNARNLTKEQKSLFNITDDQKGIEAYEQMLSSYISLQNQYDYQIKLNNKSTKELEDARKDYEKEKDEWFKEDDIAKIEDYIERLTRALDKLDDKISHLDFAKSLYGEDEVPLEYINESIDTNREKANQALSNFNAIKQGKSQYNEGTKEYLAALKTNQEAYRSAMLAINTLEDTLETEKETLEDLEEQGLEYAEEEAEILEDAAKEALEGVSSLISTIFETIDKVYEASKKLMELWNNDNAASRKSGVASLISASISGSISIGNQQQERKEEKKAIAKRKKDLADKVKDWNKEKEKHTRIKKEEYEEIIKLDREMVDTISDYADESMEQGIIERQADRDKELKKIEEDYSNTVTNISSNVNTALDTTQQKLNTMLSTIQTILEEQTKITSKEGYSATVDKNKITISADQAGNINLEDLTTSASKYRVTGINKNTGEISIEALDGAGGIIDAYKFSGKTIDSSLISNWEASQEDGTNLYIKPGETLYSNVTQGTITKTLTREKNGAYTQDKDMSKNQAEAYGAARKVYRVDNETKEVYERNLLSGTETRIGTLKNTGLIPFNSTQYYNSVEGIVNAAKKAGAFFAKFQAYAKGSKSTPAGEAFVGEEGRELILLPDGSIVLAGQDGIELANLPAGARVLTNEETEKIFKNKKDYANLTSSLKSDSGKKVNYNSYAEGTKGASNNSSSTEDFHKTELKEQEEQNQKIIESLQKRNTQIEQDEKNYHNESLKKTAEYQQESLDSADKYYTKDRQDLGTHQSKVITQTAQHRGTIKTNTDLANEALIRGAGATRTVLEETINQMKFTLPAIDSLEFVKSMDEAIQDIFTEVNAERDESGVKVGPSSGGGTGEGGSAEEVEEEKLPQGNDTTAKVWSYYKKLGFSDAGIAGIIGNMVRENGVPDPDTYEADFLSAAKKYNKDDIMKDPKLATDYFWNVVFPNTPSVKNGNGYRGTDGNYYPGFGVGSFTGPMAQDFLKYAASKGKRWDDLNTQLDYITNRLQSSGKYDLIKNATDYEQAAKDTYLGHYYPGDKSLKFFGSSAVYSGAKKALEKYSNGQYKNYVQQEKFKGSFTELLASIATKGIESIVHSYSGDSTPSSQTPDAAGWIDPVIGAIITSQYGYRIHPITGKKSFHAGVDLGGVPEGTPLYATKSGVVITNTYQMNKQTGTGYGNWIQIKTDDGYTIGYGHMQDRSPYPVGARVQQGDVIGYVGKTGGVTGAHLDYHVLDPSGKRINPLDILPGYARGGRIASNEKALVGEYGKEIILYPDGTAGLLGVNGMEYADLPAGAQIIPADETERILKNKRNYQDKAHPISSFAKGTKDLTKKEIEQTQKFLSDSGYYIGTYSNGSPLIDGIFGKLTSDALDLYFQNNKDGFASIEDLLSRILEIEEKQEKGIEDLTPNAESSSEQQTPKEELLPITDMMTKVANSMAKEKVPDADKKGIQDIIRDLGGVNWQNAVTAAETYLSAFTSDEIQKIQDTLTSQHPDYYMGEGGVVNEYLLHNFLREQDRISAENMRDVLKPVFSEQFLLAKEYVLNHGAFKTDEDYEDNYKLRLTEYINQKNTTKDIEKLIKMYQNVNAPDFTQKSTEIAAKANEEAYRFAEAELNNILTEYMAYLTLVEQGSMERDQNYENYISEVMSIISENMEDAAEAAETIKQHFEDMQDKEWTFDTERGTAFGEWNAENDLAIARDQLMTALREDPKNYEKIFDRFTAYTEGYQTMFTEMTSQMKTMNDERVEKVQILVDRATKLVTLTQEYYNEINGLNDTLHTINKELTTAKTKTQWFDEKTKEMIFNEKDYLAISQKVQENLTTAENDRLATQRLINSLGKDEQYKIDHILEAYKERATIRNKELEILKEELNLTKKQATLNDAIMNRNVRVFSGGRWRQIANIETVTKAQEDFDETKYQISKKQTELTQQLDIDSQNAAIRSNEDKISAWNKEVELVNEAFTKWQNSLIKQYDESTLNLAFFTGAFDAAARTILGIRDRYYNTYMVDDIDDLNPSQQNYHRLIAQAKQAYEATGDKKYHQLAEVYRQEAATKYNDPGWLTEGSKMDFNTYVQARGLFGENFSSPDTKSLLMTILSAKESWQALENSNLPDEVKTALQDKAHEEAESARKVLEILDPESYSLFSEETLSQSEGNPLEVFKEKIKEKYGEEVVQSIEDISNSTTAMINSVTEMVTSGAINLNAIQEVFEKATLDNLTDIVKKLRTLYYQAIIREQDGNKTVTVQSNAQGTADSKPGLSWVNEKGVEMLSTKYGQLIELNPHQKIFNNEQLNYLYEMSKQKLRGINSTIAAMTANNNNSISISDLNISLDNVTDAESFVEELRGLTQYIKNVKTIRGGSR